MKNLIPFIFGIFLFAACDKDVEDPVLPKEAYELKGIEYSMGMGDGKEVFVKPEPPLEFANNTSFTQSIAANPREGIMETSYFLSNNKDAFPLLNSDSVKVRVPVYIDDDNKIYLGERKWLYSNQITEQLSAVNLKNTVSLSPHTKLDLKINVKFQKYYATYTATFIGQTSGCEVKEKGKWIGTFPVSADIDGQFSDIE